MASTSFVSAAHDHDSPIVLEAKNFTKSFGDRLILNNLSLSIAPGELKVLIGPSGGGKSTFLQCLNYLIPPDEGELYFEGKRINPKVKTDLYALRQGVGMIFQDFNLFDHLTAQKNIEVALMQVKGWTRKKAAARALEELERVGLHDKGTLYPAELSGGQKQRVAIARALAMDPQVMLLDEPTSALDPELVGEVLAVIRALAQGGMTMIMATHQMDFARALATEILFMENGSIVERGSPGDLLELQASRTSDFCRTLLPEDFCHVD